MTRYGPQLGPDITFLGVPHGDLDDPQTYADADVVILGAPFDGGTSNRPVARQCVQRDTWFTHCRTPRGRAALWP